MKKVIKVRDINKNGKKDGFENAKRKRIAAGSNEKMRKPGTKGAPTQKQFRRAAKTAKKV